jgi:hypothetical protein
MKRQEPKVRGLPSIARAREARRGGGRWTAQAALVAAGSVGAAFIAHAIVSGRELSSGKSELLAKQRTVAATVGPNWLALRDRVETDIVHAASTFAGDHVDPRARAGLFRTQPGLYIRLRAADVNGKESISRLAPDLKRDAFTACFLREPNERGISGQLDGGAFAEQPWNLGRAYGAARILDDAWVTSVQEADDALRLRVLSEQYEKAMRDEIPVLVDVVRRARFLLLVLDEDAPEAAPRADGAPPALEELELLAHPARVHLFDLSDNTELIRLRRSATAQVIPAGERVVSDPEMRDAMKRQANNCALAGEVDAALQGPSP